MWRLLRSRALAGFKFRRQHQIGPYFADFVCLGRHLIVEVDGSNHQSRPEHDSRRDAWLRRQGFEVLRVSDRGVLLSADTIAAAILERLETRRGIPVER